MDLRLYRNTLIIQKNLQFCISNLSSLHLFPPAKSDIPFGQVHTELPFEPIAQE